MTDEPNPATSPPPPMPALRADSRDPQGGFEPLEGGCDLPNIMNKLLKRPLSLIYSLETDEDGRQILLRLLLISIASLVIFGLVVGTFSWQEQIWAAPLKIVSGLLFSGLICLPSLYIFACLGGLDAKFRTIVGLLCGLIALSGLLLVGFAPVVWLFSVSSTSITFLGFLLLSLWIVCAGFGLVLVFRAGRALGMTNTGHLTIWCGVFLLVTLQMTTTLRPIIGTSEHLVNFQEKKFFLSYWREQLNGEYEERDEREEEPGASER
jgi:hypothetical protein